MSRAGRKGSSDPPAERGVQVVLFRVGAHRFAVPREQVKAIRESPRVLSRLETGPVAASSLPLLSLSTVLGLDRDTSVDRRVLEVEHWGERLGLEVTLIEGIRDLGRGRLHPLPSLLQRNLGSANVLGILEWAASGSQAGRGGPEEGVEHSAEGPELPAVALDLSALLVEQGVEVPEPDSP